MTDTTDSKFHTKNSDGEKKDEKVLSVMSIEERQKQEDVGTQRVDKAETTDTMDKEDLSVPSEVSPEEVDLSENPQGGGR